jgi:hypothetical protein
MAFTEQQWRRLLNEIEDRRVLPVIGPELLMVETAAGVVPLYRDIATQLVEALGVDDTRLSDACSLDDVLGEYFRQPGADPADVHFALKDILSCNRWPTPEPLRQLAEITPLDVFLTVTFDSLLEDALNRVRFGGDQRTLSFSYWRTRKPDDLPAGYQIDAAGGPGPRDPAIYHLFGKFSPSKDYGLREEDILQVCCRVQSRDLRPDNLFDLMKNRSLLVLGCAFPGWLARFFYAAAKGDNFFNEAAGGVVADSTSARDASLVAFFERRRTAVDRQGDSVAMVAELHRRWTARRPASPAVEQAPAIPIKPDFVFISYASEDRTYAQLVRDSLASAGLDVWFDQRSLEAGDKFQDAILQGIKSCSFFLPIISSSTDTMERRFFRREWAEAVDEAKCRADDCPFILPVSVDHGSPDARRVPSEFKERHWTRLEGGRLPGDFVELMRARIRDLRRERRRA